MKLLPSIAPVVSIDSCILSNFPLFQSKVSDVGKEWWKRLQESNERVDNQPPIELEEHVADDVEAIIASERNECVMVGLSDEMEDGETDTLHFDTNEFVEMEASFVGTSTVISPLVDEPATQDPIALTHSGETVQRPKKRRKNATACDFCKRKKIKATVAIQPSPCCCTAMMMKRRCILREKSDVKNKRIASRFSTVMRVPRVRGRWLLKENNQSLTQYEGKESSTTQTTFSYTVQVGCTQNVNCSFLAVNSEKEGVAARFDSQPNNPSWQLFEWHFNKTKNNVIIYQSVRLSKVGTFTVSFSRSFLAQLREAKTQQLKHSNKQQQQQKSR